MEPQLCGDKAFRSPMMAWWLYLDRTAGGHRDHRHSGGDAFARSEQSQTASEDDRLEPTKDWIWYKPRQ